MAGRSSGHAGRPYRLGGRRLGGNRRRASRPRPAGTAGAARPSPATGSLAETGTVGRLVDGGHTTANAVSFTGTVPAGVPRQVVADAAAVPYGAGGDVAAPLLSSVMGLALSR